MPLSRLDNFLKNIRGNILYVDPNSLDATDNIINQGNSLAQPFKTIQRALVEASRFSYQKGLDNDRFEKTTIMLAPGEHFVDNRPGWIPDGSNNYRLRNGQTSSDFAQFDVYTNFDVKDSNNQVYKLNSIHGGVIIPRGVSIVGQDLRKCKIRPLYVPSPENSNIERSAVFRLTGGCYLQSFTVFDGDPNGTVYRDYTTNKTVPNFSHHKLTSFEYADGVNDVLINDTFLTYSTNRTDLDMYYEKVGIAYGPSSGRAISPDYPDSGVDIQTKIDEYRIVGPTGNAVGVSSIRSGDGVTASTTITVNIDEGIAGLNVDTYFQVNGVTDDSYNGTFVATQVLSQDSEGKTTSFTYETSTLPSTPLPTVTGVTVELSTDTVSGASPYIFNISMRSVYGMCGMHADGSKASGFKSMVVAQFTGVSLQVDDNAFVKYNSTTGTYDDSTSVDNIHSDPDARYKPEYENFHIKASNNSIIQLVSIFAIGFSDHFVTESGGDFSVTNSNSNFGQTSLRSVGYREEPFDVDDIGYITNIIPPRRLDGETVNLEFNSIDVSRTVGVGSTSRLYLYNQTNPDLKPNSVIQGHRIGAKNDDRLYVIIPEGGETKAYNARIVMPETQIESSQVTGYKSSRVGRSVGTGNSISSNIITFTQNHNFQNGESIRVLSDNSRLPDGLEESSLYYAITTGLNANQIKVAQTLRDSEFGTEITLNNLGGNLIVESRVSDKTSGDVGHPIQFDTSVNQWYVTVGTATSDNTLYSKLVSLGTTSLGESTSRTFITRNSDSRTSKDRIYQYRYVIPSTSGVGTARVPKDSFVIQESSDVIGTTDTEVALQYNPGSVTMSNSGELRNPSIISKAKYSGGIAYYETEQNHHLSIGSTVQVENVTSTNFTVGTAQSGYNGKFRVIGIQSARSFSVEGVSVDPGTFTNNVSNRTTSLPTFKRKNYNNDYYAYDIEQVNQYIPGQQDGVYYLTILNSSNTPQVAPFNDSKKYAFKQPIINLYPQFDRDNPVNDPQSSVTYAVPNKIGRTTISDPRKSLTRETLEKVSRDVNTGVGITDIQSSTDGTSVVIFTDRDHGLNAVTRVSISAAGAGYGNGTGGVENLYNAILSGSTSGTGGLARITVDASGSVTDVHIMNGGSGYVPTETLNIVGTSQTTGYSQATVTVDDVYNNVNDTIQVVGVTSDFYNQYNQLYRITEIISKTSIRAVPVTTISSTGINTTGIGSDKVSDSIFILTGPTLGISTFVYDNVSGLATVTTNQGHGFRTNNVVRIGGATTDFFNKDFLITDNVGINTFTINVGVSTVPVGTGGVLRAYHSGRTPQGGPLVVLNSENFGARDINPYAGITTAISSEVPNASTDEINIRNLTDFNLQIGDYLRIDDEIVRIKTTVTSNPVKVFRGLMGTRPTSHEDESVIKKIFVSPVEFRRNSIIRASGHTFEYLGYGPGNYSTALPSKQKKQLSVEDQLTVQSQSSGGGVVVYTGMNDSGDFFIGNKKISSNTGKEITYNTPIQTFSGEDFVNGRNASFGIDVVETQELIALRSLKVNGGFSNDLLSEFDGPVIFSEKLTSTSDKGIEANSIFLQGNAVVSRNFTIGVSTPTQAANPGDVVYNANPSKGGTLGWTYTVENGWYAFGGVTSDNGEFIFENVGVGTTTAGDCTLKVGSGSSSFCVDASGNVGVGTTTESSTKLKVAGSVVADTFTGDGSGLTGLSNDSLFKIVDVGTGIHPIEDRNVGFGTTVFDSTYTVRIGSPGTGGTDLYVENQSRFISTASFVNSYTSGTLTADSVDIRGGTVQVGVVTATSELRVGTSNTVFSATTTKGVGIGTATPRENLDIEGRARLKSYYEITQSVTSSSNRVEIDLARGNSFTHTTTESVNDFRVINPPTNGTFAFTLKIVQGSTPRGVGIDTFVNSIGNAISVYWPGGVVPVVTNLSAATDIYSFMSFDGGSTLYGGVIGQNFT